MRLILVTSHAEPSPQAIPLAAAFLKSALAASPIADAVTTVLCDLFADDDVPACVDRILAAGPEAVGFSLYLWNRDQCRAIMLSLRELRPSLVLFAGGPETTADPAGLLAGFACDFVVCGEGEQAICAAVARLLAGDDVAGIPGVVARDQPLPVPHGVGLVPELDSVPSPYLSGVLPLVDGGGVLWQHSRGCDYACDYCFDTLGQRGVRRFSVERLAAELDLFVASRITQVFVLDSTFNRDMARAKTLLRLIREKAPHIHFHFEVRSEFIDEEMAELFAACTCSLQIGLQSADPRVLKNVGRVFNREEFVSRIMLLNETGAVFGFDLIYGLPGDTLEGFAASLDFALDCYPNHLDIFPLAILPGTRLALRSGEWGLEHLPSPPYTLLRSATMDEEALATARGLATACDIFFSRGKAVAWFNAVVRALGLRQSGFFGHFWERLSQRHGTGVTERAFTDEQVWQLQRSFLEELFSAAEMEHLLPVALDLVDYHHLFAVALMAVPPELPTDRELATEDVLALPLTLAPSARLARFHYEIFDLLESGEPDLEEFSDCFSPTGSWAVIYPRAGEVFTESIDERFHALLAGLGTGRPALEAAEAAGVEPAAAAAFLEFAAAEGIVTLIS